MGESAKKESTETVDIGSGGWIRTSDQLINSQLRYHCATPERLNGG